MCECHGYKRDHEPGRVTVRMLNVSLRKLENCSYLRSPLSKNVPKSSKVHELIKNNARRKKGTHKTRVRFVQKMRRKPIFRTRNVNSSMRYVCNSSIDNHEKKYLNDLRFFSCNSPHGEYKGVIHRGNCTKD